jgi:ATP-dependent protease ClpP protease subunit
MFKIIIYILFLLTTSITYAKDILLTTANTVTIRGEVSHESMQKAKLELMEAYIFRGQQTYTIYLVLDTPGGSIMAGEDFIQMAKQLDNVETITLDAASMGSAIVQGLPGKRNIVSNGTLMFHRASMGIQGQVSEGEVESRLAYLKVIIKDLETRNADRMGLSLTEYKALSKDEYWLYGKQAVEKRAADEIVNVRCSNALINSFTSITIDMLLFQSTLKFSKCPVLRIPL